MKIAFDVDGVVLNSIDIILERINEESGKRLTAEDLFSWELSALGLSWEAVRRSVDHMYSQPIIEPYDEAVKVLSAIARKSDEPLLFITGRHQPETALRQLQALPWNPTAPPMIVTGGARDKRSFLQEHGVDFIIEDDPEYLQHYLDAGIGVGLMIRPWNRAATIPVSAKFEGWPALETWFNDLVGS